MPDIMSNKEMEVQLALGTLTPLKLFLKMLSMQNKDTIKSGDWHDNSNPEITTHSDGKIHIGIGDKVVFVFNSNEEFIGMFNYKD